MQDAKTGGSRWVPDIREDEITEFQEQNGDETATYKAVNVHPIISRILDKLAFFRTHVSAVWYNKLANKTVKDKLDEIDTSINSLNSRIDGTGWETLLEDGASYAKTGGTVIVQIYNCTAYNDQERIVGTLPEECRPTMPIEGTDNVGAVGVAVGNGYNCLIKVRLDGRVSLTDSSSSVGNSVWGQVIFPIS